MHRRIGSVRTAAIGKRVLEERVAQKVVKETRQRRALLFAFARRLEVRGDLA